jgi:hypothetical protein
MWGWLFATAALLGCGSDSKSKPSDQVSAEHRALTGVTFQGQRPVRASCTRDTQGVPVGGKPTWNCVLTYKDGSRQHCTLHPNSSSCDIRPTKSD